MHDVDNSSADSPIPSGYTFFAQFIDHDITLDTTTDLAGDPLDNDTICELPNIRTASLDLDCIYGFGPEASPHLYQGGTAGRLLTGNSGNPDDLARNEAGAALIGDPRNDENIFVSQMQLLWLRFHNKMLDLHVGTHSASERFEETQREVRFHYQYLVLHDFLGRVCDKGVFDFAIKRLAKGKYPLIAKPDSHGRIQMPVEFSVAAFRFGHTLVRSFYAVNGQNPDVDLFDERFGTTGFSFVPKELVVDWRFLLDVDPCMTPVMSKRIDEKLASELITMPDPIVGRHASDNERSLAFRNLLRGNALSLPCGQVVAKALQDAGYPIDPGADLKLSKVLKSAKLKKFVVETPLFFYLLREANILNNGKRMGPVGSAILLEVFGAMLTHCHDSFALNPDWKPMACVKGPCNSKFTLADIVRFTESYPSVA